MRPRVFVTRKMPGGALEELARECELTIWEEDVPPPRDAMMKNAANIDGILSLLTDRIDAEVMDAAGGSLKVISNYAVGFDNIDMSAATSRGIPVGHTPGVLTEATADLAWALLMSAARRIVEGADMTRAGRFLGWSPTLLLGCDVYGATLGIIGMGRIGEAMARRARGFSMNVVFCGSDRDEREMVEGARQVSFDSLIKSCDFFSLHVPLSDSTRGMIGAAEFQKMKPTAVLINTARGQVIDQDALCDALAQGEIAYAALDVTDPEPLPDGHRLYSLSNCIVAPHLGSGSVTTRSRMAKMTVENLLAGLKGQRLPHCVNPEVYG